MEHIMIVGAGYSGVLTAKKLAKAFRKDETISVTIIDKNPYHTMLTELHEVAAGRVDEESIKMSLRKIFAGRKVTIKQDTVTSIDFETKTVSGIGAVSYTHLDVYKRQSKRPISRSCPILAISNPYLRTTASTSNL